MLAISKPPISITNPYRVALFLTYGTPLALIMSGVAHSLGIGCRLDSLSRRYHVCFRLPMRYSDRSYIRRVIILVAPIPAVSGPALALPVHSVVALLSRA